MKESIFTAVLLFTISIVSYSQEITMFSGLAGSFQYYQDSEKKSKKAIDSLIKENSEAYQYWKKSNSHKTMSWAAFGATIGIMAWGLRSSSDQNDPKIAAYGIIATGAVSIIFYSSSKSLRKKAILTYNKSLDIGEIRLAPSNNGVGLIVSF